MFAHPESPTRIPGVSGLDKLQSAKTQDDDDIHTIQPSPRPIEEHQVDAKNKSNEIRIRPIYKSSCKATGTIGEFTPS
jgi:hypothetical protein